MLSLSRLGRLRCSAPRQNYKCIVGKPWHRLASLQPRCPSFTQAAGGLKHTSFFSVESASEPSDVVPNRASACYVPLNWGISEKAAKQGYEEIDYRYWRAPVYNLCGQKVDTCTIDSLIFGAPIRGDILHRVVCWENARKRAGTAKSKGRGDVRASTRKVRPQKGTGRARVGSVSSPIFRGGGRAFPKQPRDFSYPLQRKVREFGMRVALSTKLAQGQLGIIEDPMLESFKTKYFAQEISRWKSNSFLIVTSTDDYNNNFLLASSNIPTVQHMEAHEVGVYAILHEQKILLTKKAVRYYEENFQPD